MTKDFQWCIHLNFEGRAMRRALNCLLGLLLALGFTGCSTVTPASETPPLEGAAWVLASLPGQSSLLGQPPTARFEGGRVQGSDGCNRYTAPYTAQGSSFEVGSRGASTRMACSPEVMKQAVAFTTALGSAKRCRVTDGRLQLLGSDGAVLATFVAQKQSLAGTSWRATGINNGKGGVASIVGGSNVTVAFGADGRVSGSAGCNQFNAGYEAPGSNLSIKAPVVTRKMCANPAVMEQEHAFLKALESVTTMRFEGNRLELRTATGALALGLTREPES
jgi:heat shock protein HslJ